MGDFEKAVDDVSNRVAKTMSDQELKDIYALYKQAAVGDINIEKPGVLDLKVSSISKREVGAT
jgi:diazepam-binding inhibitor (GABA receptor modulating acyl-CoA-binding protein)